MKYRTLLRAAVLSCLFAPIFAFAQNQPSQALQQQLPSESVMLDYLKIAASEEASCTYRQLHYINLNENFFMIEAIVPVAGTQFFEFRSFTALESALLDKTFKHLPMFIVTSSNSINFWFKPAAGANRFDLIRGMYLVKKTLAAQTKDLYIDTTRLCPAGVSVHNF